MKLINLISNNKTEEKKHYIISKRLGIEEWEMMLRLQQYFSEEDAAAIIRKAKDRNESNYTFNKFAVVYSEIYMSYSVFVLDKKFNKLVEDIELPGNSVRPPRTVRTFVEELVMYNGSRLEAGDVDYLLNCRLISKRSDANKNSTANLIWTLVRTLIDNQRENRNLKRTVKGCEFQIERMKEQIKELKKKGEQ